MSRIGLRRHETSRAKRSPEHLIAGAFFSFGIAPSWHIERPLKIDQVTDLDPERLCDTPYVQERDVGFPTLDRPHVGAVDFRFRCKRLLRQAGTLARFSYVVTKSDQNK